MSVKVGGASDFFSVFLVFFFGGPLAGVSGGGRFEVPDEDVPVQGDGGDEDNEVDGRTAVQEKAGVDAGGVVASEESVDRREATAEGAVNTGLIGSTGTADEADGPDVEEVYKTKGDVGVTEELLVTRLGSVGSRRGMAADKWRRLCRV